MAQWRHTVGVCIPKEERSSNTEQFRDHLTAQHRRKDLLQDSNPETKLDFLLKNGYFDTSVQKGGVPGVPGCREHTGVVTQLIHKAREIRGDLEAVWLDPTNAYGSSPHKLVKTALARHPVLERIQNLIPDYYSDFRVTVSSAPLTSAWHRVKSIITGCTTSVSLFSLAMNMSVK